jgi:uncharacterized protein (TIGR03067 family)
MARLVIPLLVFCTSLAATQDLTEAKSKLLGKWVLVEQRLEGKATKVKGKTQFVTFNDDATFVYQTPASTLQGTWKIGMDDDKVTLDLIVKTNNGKPVTVTGLAILTIEGDTLKMSRTGFVANPVRPKVVQAIEKEIFYQKWERSK